MKEALELKYDFIAIEGNIGAGKTTLSQMLAKDFDTRLILEEFSDNPFLHMFYENPDRHAFSVELFFMSERYQQIQQTMLAQDLFQQKTISDYFFMKTLLFANNTLTGEEYRLFQRFFNILNANFPKPQLLVYLHRSVEMVMEQIKQRGREYEQEISADYLLKIQTAYLEYFKVENEIPILILDVGDIDFLNNESHYHILRDCINRPYNVGIHRISLMTD